MNPGGSTVCWTRRSAQLLLSLKRHDEALNHLRRAWAIQQEIGDQFWGSLTNGTFGTGPIRDQ